MKTFQLTLTAMLLVGLTTVTIAQDATTQFLRSVMQQEPQRNVLKRRMSSFFWYDEGSSLMLTSLLQEDIFREGIGVSTEQAQTIEDTRKNIGITFRDDPHSKQLQDEMVKVIHEHGNPFAENASEEAQQKFDKLYTQMFRILEEKTKNAVNENLTSDQLKNFREYQISIMSEYPFISPNMFEVFDLSDAQKKQLVAIKKAMEPEFDKLIDQYLDGHMKFSESMDKELEGKFEGVTTSEEQQRIVDKAQDKIRKSNPEHQRAMHDVMESGKKLAENLKIKMFDVLTDEQWNRMVDLIDNPPDYAKKMIAQLREHLGVNDSKPGEWAPGPNSWRPGDPIPEGYRQQRSEGRFPRNVQSE